MAIRTMTQDIDPDGLPPAAADETTPLITIDQSLFRDIRILVEARLGRFSMSVDELMTLRSGAVVTLETGLADHVDLVVNGACVARGEIVAVDDRFGVRIVEVAGDR
jgi:flagellar motor switch protein FliN/FliY